MAHFVWVSEIVTTTSLFACEPLCKAFSQRSQKHEFETNLKTHSPIPFKITRNRSRLAKYRKRSCEEGTTCGCNVVTDRRHVPALLAVMTRFYIKNRNLFVFEIFRPTHPDDATTLLQHVDTIFPQLVVPEMGPKTHSPRSGSRVAVSHLIGNCLGVGRRVVRRGGVHDGGQASGGTGGRSIPWCLLSDSGQAGQKAPGPRLLRSLRDACLV